MLLFGDGAQHAGGHGAPDLRLHRVLARDQKMLDEQMLLDPFEEQIHLPTALVERGDGQRWQAVLLVRNTSALPDLGAFEADTP